MLAQTALYWLSHIPSPVLLIYSPQSLLSGKIGNQLGSGAGLVTLEES